MLQATLMKRIVDHMTESGFVSDSISIGETKVKYIASLLCQSAYLTTIV